MSISQGVTTTATKDGELYRLNGAKRYITNATRAGFFTVMARSEPDVKGAGGISAFIVPAATPGITFGKPDKKMGQRGTITCDVNFDDVVVPHANIIGGLPGRGFKTAMKVLDRGRIHISALATGMSHRLVAESVAYAAERKQFGAAIGTFQLVQGLLADSRTDAFASWAMVRDVAARFDAGEKIGRCLGDQVFHHRSRRARGRPGGADPRGSRLYGRIQGRAVLPRCPGAAHL